MTREDLMNQFQNYPDVVEVTDLCAMLGGVKAKDARQLLQAGKIKSFLIGRKYQIPKECVIDYLLEDHSKEDQTKANEATQGDLEKSKGSLKKVSETKPPDHQCPKRHRLKGISTADHTKRSIQTHASGVSGCNEHRTGQRSSRRKYESGVWSYQRRSPFRSENWPYISDPEDPACCIPLW